MNSYKLYKEFSTKIISNNNIIENIYKIYGNDNFYILLKGIKNNTKAFLHIKIKNNLNQLLLNDNYELSPIDFDKIMKSDNITDFLSINIINNKEYKSLINKVKTELKPSINKIKKESKLLVSKIKKKLKPSINKIKKESKLLINKINKESKPLVKKESKPLVKKESKLLVSKIKKKIIKKIN